MHEASIAAEVIAALERRMDRGEIPEVLCSVFLRVGALRAVVPENLVFLFGVLSVGTRLEGVTLEIEPVPARGRCQGCGADFHVAPAQFGCPHCGSAEWALLSGEELLIAEVAVPGAPRAPQGGAAARER